MAIENPFVFGKAAEGTYFTDRTEDAKRLHANLTHGINTIIISPRRWGKTSLVKKVIADINRPDIKPVFIDIFQCKSEYEFYHAFASAVIKQTSSRLDEWVETAKNFLSNISPKFSFGSDPMNDFSLSFDFDIRQGGLMFSRTHDITYFTGERRGYDYELFLPLYNEVKWLEIGVDDGYDLRLTPVTQEAPIVVYGTSIGQGACASRTGMAWTNIVKRETGYPLINLAFSGNGMLEEEVFRYLNEIDAKLYILDCLPNLTEDKVPLIYDRMVRGVEMLRAEHPDVPILLVEHHYANASSSQRAIDRYADSNAEQLRAYDTLLARGFTNLYHLSHRELAFTQESMVEGIHPNDIGMRQYADAYIRKINNIFQTQKITHSIFYPRTQQRDPYNWHERHEQILQQNCLQAPQIVLIGNSITHYWTDDRPASDVKDYRASWDRLFRGRIARNLGFGFDRIENGLWRVMHGELDGYSADKIFLLLGTNNLSTNTDEEIVEGMLLLIQVVRQHQPKARIYQCGIMPRRGELQRVNNINALLKEKLNAQCSMLNVQYVEMTSGLVDERGELIESLFSDGLHPNARGYEIVARNLERYVKE